MTTGNAGRWVGAYTLAVTGDVAYFLVLSWAAVQTGGPARSGLVLAVGAIPRALLLLPGGVVADRIGPRRLVVASDALRCGVMLLAAALAWTVGARLWWLLAVALVFGVVDAVFLPAVGAMPARLVPAGQLRRMQAWRITAVRVSNAVGPTAGAVLIARGSVAAFGAVAALFAASVGLLLTVRVNRAGADAPERPSLRGTLPQLRARTGLGRLLVGTALAELPFAGPVAVGIVLLTRQHGWPVTTAGGMLTAFSLCALAVSLLATVAPTRILGRTTAAGAALLTAVLLIGLARHGTPGTAIGLSGALGLTSGVSTVVCYGLIQVRSPTIMLGRITALLGLITLGASPLLYAGTGIVAATAGIGPVFYALAVVAVLATGLLIGDGTRPWSRPRWPRSSQPAG